MKKAVIYCRVSTDTQEREGTSLDSQKKSCIDKAKELHCAVPEDYIFQEAWTGSTTDRPQLNTVRDMIRRQAFDVFICHSTDRLSRNPIHIAIIAEECEKKGIDLIFVTEPLDMSPEGALIRYVKGYSAQVEREKIKERSIRGKREKARQGFLSTGGPPLYGYTRINKKRVIDESQAKVIRRIFRYVSVGSLTVRAVVKKLNQANIESPKGGKWSYGTIYNILTNPVYMGKSYAFRWKQQAKGRAKVTDSNEWIEVEGATPAIIDDDTFKAAQKQLSENRQKSSRNRKREYLLVHHIKCSICGHSMSGHAIKNITYYRCLSNIKTQYYEKCPQRTIHGKSVEDAVWSELKRIISSNEFLEKEIEDQQTNAIPAVLETEEILLNDRINKNLREEERYIKLYGNETIDEPTLKKMLKKVRGTRESLESKLQDIKTKKEIGSNREKAIEEFKNILPELRKVINDADFEMKRTVFEMLDITVYVNGDQTLSIKGNLPGGYELFTCTSLRTKKQLQSTAGKDTQKKR